MPYQPVSPSSAQELMWLEHYTVTASPEGTVIALRLHQHHICDPTFAASCPVHSLYTLSAGGPKTQTLLGYTQLAIFVFSLKLGCLQNPCSE